MSSSNSSLPDPEVDRRIEKADLENFLTGVKTLIGYTTKEILDFLRTYMEKFQDENMARDNDETPSN